MIHHRVARFVSIVCVLAAIPANAASTSDEQATPLIDTAIPFASGAREHLVSTRGRFGQPSFQQGFVDGMHFRIDPDGSALFSRDPRLHDDVIEIECKSRVVSCVANSSVLRLSLDVEDHLAFSLDQNADFDALYVGYGKFEITDGRKNWKKLNVSLETVSAEFLASYDRLAVVKNGRLIHEISLQGMSIVRDYLAWVKNGQPVRKLPVSWEDAHDEDVSPEDDGVEKTDNSNDTAFQINFENGDLIYSPLVQFQTEVKQASAAENEDPVGLTLSLDLAGSEKQYSLKIPIADEEPENAPISLVLGKKALTGVVDLGQMDDRQIAKLQKQFGAPAPKSSIESAKVFGTGGMIGLKNAATRENDPDEDNRKISILLSTISQLTQTRDSRSGYVRKPNPGFAETVRTNRILPKITKPHAPAKIGPGSKIGGSICKPAILASINGKSAARDAKPNGVYNTRSTIPKNFSDPSEALKGLPGIHVFTDYLAEPLHLKGKFNHLVHDEIEARLRSGGIKVLTKEELPKVPGQPRMEVYFSKANALTGCSFAVWISVRQSILLGRDNKVMLLAGTWGSGGAHLRQYNDAPEFNTIMHHVDRFIADYQKANPRLKSSSTH